MKIIILCALIASVHSTLGSECGGTVEVGAGENVIEYSPEGGYQNYEYCIWTLLPTQPYSGYSIDYVSYGMEHLYDGVAAYSWTKDGVVVTNKIGSNVSNLTTLIGEPHAIIAFSSDHSNPGQGFRLTITGTGELEGEVHQRGFVLDQTAGNFSYPEDFGVQNYTANERVAVAVQVQNNTYTEVAVDYTDINDDSLLVYRLLRYNNGATATLFGRTSGSNRDGVPALTSSSPLPRLLVFLSNSNVKTGSGFSISWKPQPA